MLHLTSPFQGPISDPIQRQIAVLNYMLLWQRSRILAVLERFLFRQGDEHPIPFKAAQLKAHHPITRDIDGVIPLRLSWFNPFRGVSRTYGYQVRTVIIIMIQKDLMRCLHTSMSLL